MNYVAYLRVSTDKQGASGLGLDAQKAAIKAFVKPDDRLVDYFIEIESGKHADRPELLRALSACELKNARLLVAKLDRLSRNVAFIATLMESKTGFVACDMPDADPFRLHLEAMMAEDERRRISKRTTEALAAAKKRGVALGGSRPGSGMHSAATREKGLSRRHDMRRAFLDRVSPTVAGLRAHGFTTLTALAAELNRRNVRAQYGGVWYPQSVARLLSELDTPSQITTHVDEL